MMMSICGRQESRQKKKRETPSKSGRLDRYALDPPRCNIGLLHFYIKDKLEDLQFSKIALLHLPLLGLYSVL